MGYLIPSFPTNQQQVLGQAAVEKFRSKLFSAGLARPKAASRGGLLCRVFRVGVQGLGFRV